MMPRDEPHLVGGFGKINFGKQYRQGNRIYDADYIAMALTAQPLGNTGGYSYLYIITRKVLKMNIILLEHPTDEDWMKCKQRALVTMGKKAINPPDDEWKYKMLNARHSPIRKLNFSFYLEDIPSYCSVHLVRHIHAQPYVKSQRNDRQNEYDRTKAPQDAPVNMIWDMNAEELMVIANKRLCNLADVTTREIVKAMVSEVIKVNPEFKPFLVPNCKYLGGCKEMFPCGINT